METHASIASAVQTSFSRRTFVKGALSAAFAAPRVALGRNALGRATIALIGAGTQGRHLLHQFLGQDVAVTAVCDCDKARRENRTKVVNDYYAANPQLGVPKDVCRSVADFREIISDKSIDMVCIATPDHWHAYMVVEAMKAGKDVYCEKPLAHNVNEAKTIMAVAKRTGRVLQTGAMQRSSVEFRVACEIVRNGFIGDVKKVDAVFGGPSQPPRDFWNPANAANEGRPNPDVDFDMWCGPAPLVKYSDRLAPRGVHRHFPDWRSHDYFGMGGIGDFGAHNLDIAQWGLGMDESGPVKVVKSNAVPSANPFDGGRRQYDARLVFGNGAEIRHVPHGKMNYADVFYGTEGAVAMDRGAFALWLGKDIRQLPVEELKRLNTGDLPGVRKIGMFCNRERGVSDRSLLEAVNKAIKHFNLKKAPVKLYKSLNHPADFVNCVKTRRQPNSRAEVGARASILCNLLQLSYVHDTGFDWNPAENLFANGTGNPDWLDGFYKARNNLAVKA